MGGGGGGGEELTQRKRSEREEGRGLVGCLTSQQDASVSQGRICSVNSRCCHTEIEVADQTFYLTQSQSTDTGHWCMTGSIKISASGDLPLSRQMI